MTKIQFELDGRQVEANPGETIWQVAKRQGREIPHLCYPPEPGLPAGRQLPRLHGRDRGRARAGGLLQAHAERRHEGEDGEPARGRGAENGDGASGRRPAGARNLARSGIRNSGTGPKRPASAKAAFPPPSAGMAMPAIRRCASISTPASSAACACAPAARSRSTTSSAWPIATTAPRSCSISTIRWGNRPASPAANACRPARPAR